MNPDGTDMVRVTNNTSLYDENQNPSWSPDGRKIAFERDQISGQGIQTYQVYTMNPDGTDQVALDIKGAHIMREPNWGSHPNEPTPPKTVLHVNAVLANSSLLGSYPQIRLWTTVESDGGVIKAGYTPLNFTGNTGQSYTVTIASTNLYKFEHWNGDNSDNILSTRTVELVGNETTLTGAFDIPQSAFNGKLVFSSDANKNWEIYTMNPDGTGVANISNMPHSNETILFLSQDNSKIYFSSDEPDGTRRRFVVNADGTGLVDVSSKFVDPFSYPYVAWSADHSKIAYAVGADPQNPFYGNIFAANADGSNPRQLTNTTSNGLPAWSPDGNYITFLRHSADGFAEGIYIMNSTDGSGQRRFNDSPGGFTIWSPDGRYVAYNIAQGYWYVDRVENGNMVAGFGRYGPVIWSPDSSRVLFDNSNPNAGPHFSMYLLYSHISKELNNEGLSSFGPAAWSPDSNRFAIVTTNTSTNQTNTSINIVTGNDTNPALNPIRPEKSVHYGELAWAVASSPPSSSPPLPPPPGSDTATLTIKVKDQNRKDVSGVWSVIKSSDTGSILKSGFTPLTFAGNLDSNYTVTVANYDGKIFQYWQGEGHHHTASSSKTITLSSKNTTLTAIYDTGDSLRGFTPLSYLGKSKQPDLTIRSAMTGDAKDLHMYVLIDPQSSDKSVGTTTYKVYAGDYLNMVFEHWSDGNKDRIRILAIGEATTLTAYYKTTE